MHLLHSRLKNTYYGLRHAHSKANELHRIISHPQRSRSGYGLSAKGQSQCLALPETVRKARAKNPAHFSGPIRILTSDFKRALQTAQQLALSLSALRLGQTRLLRERYFGHLEQQSDHLYESVWTRDRLNGYHRAFGVEPVQAVARRMQRLIERCESRYFGHTLIFVSHGDTLQILACLLLGRRPELHRAQPPLRNAELRLFSAVAP